MSPDGMGSFCAYITPVAQEPIAQHMKNVAFADGEQITHLRGERTWIEVSGSPGLRAIAFSIVSLCSLAAVLVGMR